MKKPKVLQSAMSIYCYQQRQSYSNPDVILSILLFFCSTLSPIQKAPITIIFTYIF